jgi:hypothetical protein
MVVVGATVGASPVLLSMPLSAPVERGEWLRRVKRMLVVLKKLAESYDQSVSQRARVFVFASGWVPCQPCRVCACMSLWEVELYRRRPARPVEWGAMGARVAACAHKPTQKENAFFVPVGARLCRRHECFPPPSIRSSSTPNGQSKCDFIHLKKRSVSSWNQSVEVALSKVKMLLFVTFLRIATLTFWLVSPCCTSETL